jgi:hypothetical protein
MQTIDWRRRGILVAQRFWQPTSACLTCMPGNWDTVMRLEHWSIALRTGLTTGALALLLTFTPLVGLYANRFGNALIVALLTTLGEAYSHKYHFGFFALDRAVLTGMTSGLFAMTASYLLEDHARRLRGVWARLFGSRTG